MEYLIEAFTQNNFKVTKKTNKSVEFEHAQNREVVYLLFNGERTIVLDPKTVEGNVELEKRSFGINHNTSFGQFPKKKHMGKESIHYGYSFKF